MKKTLVMMLILALGPLSGFAEPEPPPQSLPDAIVGATPIGGLLSGLKGIVKQIEDSGHSLIAQLDVDLGAQQVLMAGTLKATITQFEQAYARSLTLTFDKADVQTQNAYRELDRIVSQGKQILTASVAGAQGLIYQTQGAANQLLASLPIGFKKTPVYYGFTTRDILAAVNQSAWDIEILGFWLKDETLKKNPKITVADVPIPDANIDARFDRILVKLPQELHDKLRLDDKPCDPIKTFAVKIQVFYTNHPWLSSVYVPFVDSDMTFNGWAVTGQPVYEATASFSGDTVQNGTQEQPYQTTGQYVEVGCGGTTPASSQYVEPHGWNISSAVAQWINVDKGDVDSSANFSGATAIARGQLHGHSANMFGDCGGGGHGTLIVKGTYTMPTPNSTPYDVTLPSIRFSNKGSVVVPSGAGLTLKGVKVIFRKAQCSTNIDDVAFSIPADDPNRNVGPTTTHGLFTVTYDRGNVTFEGTDLLARQ